MSTPTASGLSVRSTKAKLFAAYKNATHRPRRRPFMRMELTRLVACDSQSELAAWVIGQLVATASCGDEHARSIIAALRLKMSAEEMASGDGETT